MFCFRSGTRITSWLLVLLISIGSICSGCTTINTVYLGTLDDPPATNMPLLLWAGDKAVITTHDGTIHEVVITGVDGLYVYTDSIRLEIAEIARVDKKAPDFSRMIGNAATVAGAGVAVLLVYGALGLYQLLHY